MYGAGNGKLGEILGVSKTKAKNKNDHFLKNWPELSALIAKVKEAAQKNGYLKGLDGRKIYVRALYSALNTLFQGAGTVVMKKALVLCDTTLQKYGLRPGYEYEFVANVHDEFQIEALDEDWDEESIPNLVGRIAAWSIAQAGSEYNMRCPLEGEYQIGNNWAETH